MVGIEIWINGSVEIETQGRVSTFVTESATQMKHWCHHQAHLMDRQSTDYQSYPVQI